MVCAGIQILVQSVFTPPPNTSTGPSLDFNTEIKFQVGMYTFTHMPIWKGSIMILVKKIFNKEWNFK